MKTISSFFIAMMLLLSSPCMATTTVNSEQKEFITVQAAILQFHKDTQKFPSSWDDLWNNDASKVSVEHLDQGKILGRRTDMIESFRFIATGTTILVPIDGSRVIGMMTRPMRPPPETQRRFLIVQLKDGTMGTKQIPEDVLRNIFSRAGFDLADYTGPNGNWAPETRLRRLSEIPPPPERKISSNTAMDHNAIPRLPLSKMLSTERKKQLWIAGGIALLMLLGICVWRLIVKAGWRQKSERSNH